MRKVIVHSDGTGDGTVVLDEDGKQVADLSNIFIDISANDVARATLEVSTPQVNVTASVDSVKFKCPLCKEENEHHCSTTLGGFVAQCGSMYRTVDPVQNFQCIRAKDHDEMHFDGRRVWP